MRKFIIFALLNFLSTALFAQSDVKSLAHQLSEHQANDSLKVVAFYNWISHNIEYDYATFKTMYPLLDLGQTQSCSNVLKTKKALCGGYSTLFYQLCKQVGIKAEVIEGLGKVRNSSDPNDHSYRFESHAWNAVKLNNKWYLLDLTWSAGAILNEQFVRKINTEFYMTSPTVFRETHWPSDPLWQLIYLPISKESFIQNNTNQNSPLTYLSFPDTLKIYERLDSTQKVLNSQKRILRFDPSNDNAKNILGFYSANVSLTYLEKYAQLSRKIKNKKSPQEQQRTALDNKDQLYALLKQGEEELRKGLWYYDSISDQAKIKGIPENKKAIFQNLEAIEKDREMLGKYFVMIQRMRQP
ncbi:MAG: transglutaminase domain-containing protein [Spirosomataceae bacterium]